MADQTDKERLLALLADFGITPAVAPARYRRPCDEVRLNAEEGGVLGYMYFTCVFTFNPDGSFIDVGVWE